jgi:hypothetical protein
MFDLITSTGVLFTYTVRIPDRAVMQMVEFTIDAPYTEGANVVLANVASLATLGKSVEQTLVEHVEHYEQLAARNAAAEG